MYCSTYTMLKNICLILEGIWKTYSVAGQTQIIWQDPQNQGWKVQTPYRFFLKHRPQTGVINLQIYEGSVKIGEKLCFLQLTVKLPNHLLSCRHRLSNPAENCITLFITLSLHIGMLIQRLKNCWIENPSLLTFVRTIQNSTYSVILDCFYTREIDLYFWIHHFWSHGITTIWEPENWKKHNFFTIVDSGDVIDFGLSGGRVGVFTCSQDNGIWSDMSYRCQE